MLIPEMNQGIFSTPEMTLYASLKDVHRDIKEEVTLLKAALDALNAKDNPSFNTAYKKLEHGEKLLKRYESIRGNEDMSFRDYLFYLHAYRISLTFARLNVAQTLILFTFTQMATTLAAPVLIQLLLALSVAFLALRLLRNVLNACKHARFPSAEEERGIPSSYDRFIYELSLVDLQILNDIVWVSANLFTNYPEILGLSPLAVNTILLSSLTFDLFLSAYMYYQNETAYASKNSEYEDALDKMVADDINYMVLSEQHKQLKLDFLGKRAALQQFLAAGTVILIAFSLIASSALPFFLPLGAALCVFGASLYLTAGKRGACIKTPSTENDNAYTDALIKNTVYPLLFMVAAANLAWPITLLLAASVAMYAPLPDPLKNLRKDCVDGVSSLPKHFGFA